MMARCWFCLSSSLIAFSLLVIASAPRCHAQNQSLEGQLTALAEEIRTFHTKDRLHRGKKMRLTKVTGTNVPDANFDQPIQDGLANRLKDVLDEKASLELHIEWTFLESTSATNQGKQVIQIAATIVEDGRPIPLKSTTGKIEPLIREVNNSGDIAKLIGATLAPPDTTDHATRLKAIEESFENPQFSTQEGTRIAAVDQPSYAVEIRKRVGVQGDPVTVAHEDQLGMAFVAIDIGDTYDVVLYNFDDQADAVAKLEIDGLDVINTFNVDVDPNGNPIRYPGYFIARATNGVPGKHIVPGWMRTTRPSKDKNDNVFQFVVNELGKGAATATRVRGTTGVITVRFFDAYSPSEVPRSRNFGETAAGKPMRVDYELKPVLLGDQPLSIVSVRYTRQLQP
ncbi:MAG: hypothetical protein ACK6DC_03950 [Planctomycetota bacterium]